jgi:hypothetical protein
LLGWSLDRSGETLFRTRLAIFGALIALGFGAGAISAWGDGNPKVHELFEARCGRCHDHAGPLARETLTIVNDELHSRKTAVDIRPFLARHYGRLNPAEVALVYNTFRAQVAAAGRFQERCRICHGRARELAEDRLIIVGGRLMGRYSGRDIQTFLAHHGRPRADEAALFHDVLLGLTDSVSPVTKAAPGTR